MLIKVNKTWAGLLLAFALLTSGMVNAASQASDQVTMPPMFLEDTSPANFPRTVETFKAEIKTSGWSILTVHNMAGILSTKGYTLQPILVIEACSGKYSAQLLENDDTRYVASMLPCRVAIYQTSTGKVVISRMNNVMFAGTMDGIVAEVIKKSGADMEAIIARTLTKLEQK